MWTQPFVTRHSELCQNAIFPCLHGWMKQSAWWGTTFLQLFPDCIAHWYESEPWASCQIRKITGCAFTGMLGTFSPQPRVSDPDMHHGTCVTHVPGCMPGSLTSDFIWIQWRGNRSWHSLRMRNTQFYVSGKRPMANTCSVGQQYIWMLTRWHICRPNSWVGHLK